MPKLILVCGLPGTGKTTLSHELSKRLGLVCLHKDTIKEHLYDGLNLATLEDSKKIGGVAANLLMALAEEQLANGIDIVLEAPFNFESDYPRMESWQKEYGCNIVTIVCDIGVDVGKTRIIRKLI